MGSHCNINEERHLKRIDDPYSNEQSMYSEVIRFRKSKEQGSASAGSLPHLMLTGRRKPGGRSAAGGCLTAQQALFLCIWGRGRAIVMWGPVPARCLSQCRGQQHGEGRHLLGFATFPLSEPTLLCGLAGGCGALALGFMAKVSVASTAEWQIQTKLMFSGRIHAILP